MAMNIAAEIGVLLKPVAPRFWKRAEADIESQNKPELSIDVDADTKKATGTLDAWHARQSQRKLGYSLDIHTARANAELEAFRKRQEGRRLKFGIDLDKKSVISLENDIKRVEHYYKGNPSRRAIRFQIYVAGAVALPALNQGILSVVASMTDLTRAGLLLPGMFSGIAAAVATVTTGLQGISGALKASNDGLQNSAQYARQYAQATRELENAQRDVVNALKQANREIEDQKDKLAQGQLSVEQARINVRRANERMLEGGFSSVADYQQAVLDVKRANLDLGIAVKENSRGIQDYYDQASKGALASDTYRDSLDRLSSSVENFNKAQFQAAGMSEQFINAMKNLSPAGQDFVLEVIKLRGAWKGLQDSIQTTLFKGLGDSITKLAQSQLPMLKTGMQNVAASINKDFKAILETLGRQANSNSMAKVFDNTARALEAMRPGIESAITGFLKLSEVGSRFLPRLSLAFNKVMGRFERFVDLADRDGSLERWIDRGLKVISSLGRSFMNIGSIFSSLTTAYGRATGNIGGFAITVEKQLKKLADRYSSAAGQRGLIEWINQSKLFIQAIKDDLPGIRAFFHALGEGARFFATYFYPVLAGIGKLAEQLPGLTKFVVAFYIASKTLGPIGTVIGDSFKKASGAAAAYKKNLALLKIEYVDAAKSMTAIDKVRNQALAIQADPKTSPQAVAAKAAHKEAGKAVKAAKAEVAAAQRELASAQAAMAALPQRRRTLGLNVPDGRDQIAERNAKAIAREAAAQESLVAAQRQSRELAGQVRTAQTTALSSATRTLAESADDAAKAQTRLNTAAREATTDGPRGWMNRMNRGIGSGRGGGLIGALAGLTTAFGGITAALGGAAIMGSVIYAINEYTNAKDRATMAADNMREAEDRLRTSLAKGTGSATGETLEANLSELGSYKLPARKNETIDAVSILDAQAGIAPSEAASLALPTESAKREARLAPTDAKIIAAVPELDQWKKFGLRYRANGVDETVFGKALNGDPDSIAKVEAARLAIKNSDPIGGALNLGAAVAVGAAPNDLGTAQQQLPTGEDGGLRGLSQAAGALRGVGRASAAAAEKSRVSPLKQGGLNPRGQGLFSQFVIGPGGAQVLVDGSAVIEVDKYPDDIVQGWIESAAPKGISVERRYPSGAIIKIDPESAGNYFNPVGKYAMGGAVWGAGTATSDSIPAMLSNGEFVINAKSASLIGHDKLTAMNNLRGYAPGGPVKRDGGTLIGPGGSTDNYWPLVPIVTNAQTLPEAIGLPTTKPGNLIGPSGSGSNYSGPSSITKRPGDLPGFLGSLGLGGSGLAASPGPKPQAIPNPPSAPPALPPPTPGARVFGPPKTTPGVPHVGYGQPGPGGRKSTTGYPPLGPFTQPAPQPAAGPSASAGQSSGIGGRIGPGPNGAIYIPKWIGSGALQDTGSTAASAAPNAQVNRNANILDYLVQVSNAYGLRPGSGPNDTMAGRAIAEGLGIATHFIDGGQHSVDRALDIGSPEQAESGLITSFVKEWMQDPEKVAATRQLIFQDPKTGESFGIIQGRALFGQELQSVYGGDFSGHRDHLHLALEGVPLDAFDQSSGLGAPIGGIAKPPSIPAATMPGPAVDIPPTTAGIDTPDVAAGPAEGIPFNGMDFLKKLGAALLNGIFGFFGVDGSAFVDFIFNGLGGFGKKPEEEPAITQVPQPDDQLLSQMDQQIAMYEGLGTTEGDSMAESLKKTKEDYLKQYTDANLADSTEGVAKYLESIGDPEGAAKLRENAAKASQPQESEFLRRWREYLGLPKSGSPAAQGAFVAPAANYSGGSPETHNAIYRAFREAGYPDSEWPSLVELLNHENDTYDPTRPTGGPNSDASGIFQFLSTTWDEVGMEYSTDPYIQSVAGMRYIKKRYGTPTAAWNFWQNPNPPGPDPNWPHWYAGGGIVRRMSEGGSAYYEEGIDPLEAIYGPPFLSAFGPGKGGTDLSHIRMVFPEENAAGGYISGPGTGTSDSIPAMLSNGEFVMRAKAVDHWGVDRLHAMNKFSEGGSVGNWWENTKNFGKGFVGAGKELITGIAPLVGLAGDGAPGVADSWKAMATGMAPLVGLGGAGAPGVGEAWKQLGQGAIRYDQWTAGGTKAEAAGGNLFDILTAVLPGGALTKGVKAGKTGASIPESAPVSAAAPSMSLPKAIAPSLKPIMDLEGNAAGRIVKPPRKGGVHPNPGKTPKSGEGDNLGYLPVDLPVDELAGFIQDLTDKELKDFLDNGLLGDAGYVQEKIMQMYESGALVRDDRGVRESLEKLSQQRRFAEEQAVRTERMRSEFLAGGDPLGAFMPGERYLVPRKPSSFGPSVTSDGQPYPPRRIGQELRNELETRVANPRVMPNDSEVGPAQSYVRAAEYARSIWRTPVEDIPYRVGGSGGGSAAVDIPFTDEQFKALKSYSKSSSVNKSMRGMEDLPGIQKTLERLIAIRPQMSGSGGQLPGLNEGIAKLFSRNSSEALLSLNDNDILGLSPTGAPIYSKIQGLFPDQQDKIGTYPGLAQETDPAGVIDWITGKYAEFAKYRGNGPGGRKEMGSGTLPPVSTQQIWEAVFMEYLKEARKRLSAVLQAKDTARTIDSAFEMVDPLPRDMWATRMTDKNDFALQGMQPFNMPNKASGDVGFQNRVSPDNPGFTSMSLGISRNNFDDWSVPEYVREAMASRRLWEPAPVFSSREVMMQELVRRGTRGLYFGGGEREIVFPRGGDFLGYGAMLDTTSKSKVNALNFDQGEGADIFDDSYITGREQMKVWGEASFPDEPPPIPELGVGAITPLLRDLGRGVSTRAGSGRYLEDPGWMDLMAPVAPGELPWTSFMIPQFNNLEFANGGHVSGPGGPKSDMIPAMLSNGEFVMSAAATKKIGASRLMAMNKFANGGPVVAPPSGGSDPDAWKDLSKVLSTPLIKPAASGSSDPDAFKDLEEITPASIAGSLLAPKGGGGGMSAGAAAPKPKDPRAILGAAPRSDTYINPALAGAIKGGFSTVGGLVSQAAGFAGAAASAGVTGGAPIPGAGQATSALVSAGFQMAGDVAVGAANIISALLVGTATPSQTGQGYGAPLLPQQQQQGGGNNFQSIHNGNVVTNNLTEYSRLKDRKDAQKAAPFFNRVNQ